MKTEKELLIREWIKLTNEIDEIIGCPGENLTFEKHQQELNRFSIDFLKSDIADSKELIEKLENRGNISTTRILMDHDYC